MLTPPEATLREASIQCFELAGGWLDKKHREPPSAWCDPLGSSAPEILHVAVIRYFTNVTQLTFADENGTGSSATKQRA